MSKRFAIEVLDVNEPPVSISLSSAVIHENASLQSIVGTLSAEDRDAVQRLTFSLDDSADGKFALENKSSCFNSTSGGTRCQTLLKVIFCCFINF